MPRSHYGPKRLKPGFQLPWAAGNDRHWAPERGDVGDKLAQPSRKPGRQVDDAIRCRQSQQRPVEVQRPVLEMVTANPHHVGQVNARQQQNQRVCPVAPLPPPLPQHNPRQRYQQVQPDALDRSSGNQKGEALPVPCGEFRRERPPSAYGNCYSSNRISPSQRR